jgi:phage/plasmid-associated DNA primase
LIALANGDQSMKAVIDGASAPTIATHSEDALALRFTKKHGKDLRFVAKWGKWLKWTGGVWKRDETEHVLDMCRDICRAAASECHLKHVAQRVASAKTVAAIERLARVQTGSMLQLSNSGTKTCGC